MSIIKKNVQKTNVRDCQKSRLRILGVGITVCFLIVVIHLVIIQFVEGKELSEKAYNQQVKNKIISPNRGTIYDATGETLAKSIPVDTISLNPGKVVYANSKKVSDEVIAEGLSNILNVTYEELMNDLKSNKSVIVVEKKVETDKVEQVKKWMEIEGITAGINIDEDSKRYYPYDDLASNLIGFCGTDNVGQTGLEQRWNSILTGTAGKIVTTTDVDGNAISDEDEQYIASENGSNIYLTIDAKIQAIAEKYLEQAMFENNTAKSGNVIIMKPQTGDILAMATYPDYNLNKPSSYLPTGYTEEAWNKIEYSEKTNILLDIWKNRGVSGTYEPGSTFKLIVAAIGLEEGIVKTDTAGDFYCGGSYLVADEEIKCWRHYNPHQYLSLRGALCNSCNPAFMQLGQRIGATKLYKYFEAFGLFDSVGSDIAKAYPGTFYDLQEIASVELATTSFGQRFEISPLQLITAVSAICNDGVLVEPKIVKQIENTDTGSIEVIDTKQVRQVISSDTSDKIKDMMLSVVTTGTGKQAKVEGYSIGGKSGTSEPKDSNKEEGYVASFVAISPIENTQVITLVTIDGLAEAADHQGGQVAGPVASQIMSEVLPYLDIASTTTAETESVKENEANLITVPNVKDKTVSQAITDLQNLGFSVIYNSSADKETTIVVDQVPKSGISLNEGAIICLYASDNDTRVKTKVPNIKGMTAEAARNTLRANNLNIQIDGTVGYVVSQEPTYETDVEEGTVINVVIKEALTDAQ